MNTHIYIPGKRCIFFIKRMFTAVFILIVCALPASAQNFASVQRSQERTIKTAYRNHRVTPNEYEKLMHEQDAIRYAIKKYAADGIWTLHEKDVVNGKLQRAAKRIRRYKTNNERY